MTLHVCRTCRKELPSSASGTPGARKQSRTCRECRAAYQRLWYQTNRERHKERARRHGADHRKSAKELIRELKDKPCMDCDGRFPHYVMDFDHVRGKKVRGVSAFPSRKVSNDRLLEEIEKCDLVCANCHRLRTARRLEESGKNVYWAVQKRSEPGA